MALGDDTGVALKEVCKFNDVPGAWNVICTLFEGTKVALKCTLATVTGTDTEGPGTGTDTEGPGTGTDTEGPDTGTDTEGTGVTVGSSNVNGVSQML